MGKLNSIHLPSSLGKPGSGLALLSSCERLCRGHYSQSFPAADNPRHATPMVKGLDGSSGRSSMILLNAFSATAINKVHYPVQGEGFPDKSMVSGNGRGFEQRVQDGLFRRFDGRLKER